VSCVPPGRTKALAAPRRGTGKSHPLSAIILSREALGDQDTQKLDGDDDEDAGGDDGVATPMLQWCGYSICYLVSVCELRIAIALPREKVAPRRVISGPDWVAEVIGVVGTSPTTIAP
jgi:hypothetical protein